jgi:hypothetical protein
MFAAQRAVSLSSAMEDHALIILYGQATFGCLLTTSRAVETASPTTMPLLQLGNPIVASVKRADSAERRLKPAMSVSKMAASFQSTATSFPRYETVYTDIRTACMLAVLDWPAI